MCRGLLNFDKPMSKKDTEYTRSLFLNRPLF